MLSTCSTTYHSDRRTLAQVDIAIRCEMYMQTGPRCSALRAQLHSHCGQLGHLDPRRSSLGYASTSLQLTTAGQTAGRTEAFVPSLQARICLYIARQLQK